MNVGVHRARRRSPRAGIISGVSCVLPKVDALGLTLEPL